MTEDQHQQGHLDRRSGGDLRASASVPVPTADQVDHKDLRELFRRTAPIARSVDVEALFSAAEVRGADGRLLAWSRLIGRPRNPFLRPSSAEPLRTLTPWKRGIVMTLRIAAGFVFVAGIAALFIPRESAANVTFAEVQAKVKQTQTVTGKVTTVTLPTPQKADESYRLLIRGPHVVRLETSDGGYTITDYHLHKSILVDPAQKSARVFESINLPTLNFYEFFRSIATNPIKQLPAHEINGKKVVGFIARPPALEGARYPSAGPKPETTVWVDPQTKLPLQIQTTSNEQGGVNVTQTVTDISFDIPLDAALFDMTPPAGFNVESFGMAKLQPGTTSKDAVQLVITPAVGIGPVRFGMTTADVLRLLGCARQDLESDQGNRRAQYYSRGFSITTRDKRGVVMITCYTGKFFAIKARAFGGRTDKGIRLGASRRDRKGLRRSELGA